MLDKISLKDKKVLLRVDYNVPINHSEVMDDYRIKKTIPTINYCLEQGASLTIISHLGRPTKYDENYSLYPVSEKLEEILGKEVIFSEDCISNESFMNSSKLKKGEIHMLENLRFHDGEISNCPDFSRQLSFHGDVFINDAFGTAHRSHASNVGVSNFFDEKSMGLLMEKELKYLKHEIKNPQRPLAVIMGGAKIKGKIELIEKFLDISDYLLIGGALSFPFLKIEGIDIESSLIDKESLQNAKKLLDYADMQNKKIIFPSDFVTASSIEAIDTIDIKSLRNIDSNSNCYDIGPETTMLFSQIVSEAKTILWNGPLGVSENPYFGTGTQQICRIVEELTNAGATSILGGGDTASAARRFSQNNFFTHISTGGGASLELLSGKELPAIKALGYYE